MGSCLPGFERNPLTSGTCVPECPRGKGFTLQSKDGIPACVYSTDPTKYATLKPVGLVQPGDTLESLKTTNRLLYEEHVASQSDFESNFPVIESQVGTQQQIDDAFQALQAAENARDKSPEAYQSARIRYYTLTKGENWLEEERKRIAGSEVDPKIARYMSTFNSYNTQLNQQNQTKDAVRGVKDNVLSLRDDFEYSVNTLGNQLKQLKDQIQLERRRRETKAPFIPTSSWVDILLNALIVISLLVVIVTLVRRSRTPAPAPVFRSTTGV
jgi:hypothetical protein